MRKGLIYQVSVIYLDLSLILKPSSIKAVVTSVCSLAVFGLRGDQNRRRLDENYVNLDSQKHLYPAEDPADYRDT